ncbi:ABC transporter permease [Pseudosulfitobacter pseudonitzschiae]|uniref:ABC transporter permease n=1 Tax=Pseudosulfitobacter pseudonitzschiae TaxID=1402135 RepID=A0A073IZP2_9RHOB|nr:ABC transporter permease [Pseudosulfitobacter pseudonitzschiae]KEJ95184.1 ABC transporter permease [Pseudosulfitobacter pseudonitzschiae]MBM1816783.1 ABC transporter permease [Pseudosulfitobacter pseudonitzschiae]MBM1833594.1 ABC transporter permease [Pseudosulfitobacter pseudonitzschiae]MBM1838460.1 ABC transporter permease [Pseudosulfitobacter pseudonitzschiae]MBM1843510.1 ABC transporter permease [Pseudosulfitobacter pseudonitzschiae]
MWYFIFRRTAGFVATLFVVSAVVFAVMNILPGDPALTILGLDATDDALAALREQLGLNQPVLARYVSWIWNALQGDFGISHSFRVPVSELIAERLPMTVSLAVAGMIFTLVIALSLGIGAAARHRKVGDWGVMFISQIGIAVPAFWLSMLLVLLFAVKLRWLPPGGFAGWSDPVAAMRSLVLPTIALGVVQSAVLARVTRSSALEVMRQDFVRTARASGLSRRRVLWRHVLPNALVPIVTIVGMQFAALVTGTIVIENVFYLPGLGRLIFQSISNRDLPTVQALVMLFAAIVVTANFVVDLLYVVIDPRLKART